MSYPDFLLDKRVIERNLAKGVVNRKDLEKHMKSLRDVADNAEQCAPPEEAEASEAEGTEES